MGGTGEAAGDGLEGLYGRVPGVPCTPGCTACCVTPTMTMVEFIHLMRHVYAAFPPEAIRGFLSAPMRPHARFEGNHHCRFHGADGRCAVHPARALACRLHGLPVIERLGISEMENCTLMPRESLPDVPVAGLRSWLDDLMARNRRMVPEYYEPVYRISALNVEGWLDLLHLDDFRGEVPLAMQAALRENLDWRPHAAGYRPLSELKEKIDCVSLLVLALEAGDAAAAAAAARRLRDDFATAGSYYRREAAEVLEALDAGGRDGEGGAGDGGA